MAACVSRGSPGISFACSSVKWLSNLKMLSVINMRMPKSSFSSSVSDKITVNGLDLHYEKAGSHSHVVLCMPGALGSTQSDFGPQLTGLSDRFTVVAFDPRGYGKSRPPERDFPSDFFVRDAWDAAELMRKLGYPKYSLLGWSDGGITAMILAASNPRAIDKMVVWGANASVTQEDVDMYDKARDVDKWNPKMRDPLEALYGAEGLRAMWKGWLAAIERVYKEKGGNLCQDMLPKIKCPTLIVHGDKDPMVPQFHAEYLHKHIAGSVLRIWPEGRHNIHLRYPEEFNDIVSQFLKEE